MNYFKEWIYKWRDPYKYIPLLGGIVFIGGLLYTVMISNMNSKNLIEIQNNTYPLLEKSTLLKVKLKSIQSEYYYAVTQEDWEAFLSVEIEETEFLDLLRETKPYLTDQNFYRTLETLTREYIQLSDQVGQSLVENGIVLDSTRSLVFQLNQKTKQMNDLYEKLNEKGNQEFKEGLIRSQIKSLLMLRVEMVTVVSGMIIIGGFLWFIMLLNGRLSQVNRSLEKKVSELEAFVYTVSHDLKSPVVSMQGMASIFMEDYGKQVDEKGRFYIKRIIANAGFMEDLIQGLLLLSRAGRKSGKMEMASVRKVIQDVLFIHQELFKEKRIEVVVKEDLPDMVFERMQLHQIFQNLLSNAAKFAGDQPFPKVTIGGKDYKDRVEYYIMDNGIGIDPAYHEKVFGVFQRLEDVHVEGTGIGLSIVKKIIDLAGGKIWIHSQKEKGTTFFFTLPKVSA